MVGDVSIPVLRPRLRRPQTTWLALAWIVAISVAPMLSVLVRSRTLGPFDILYNIGLTKIPGVSIHNPISGDQITQMIPWSTLNWRAVHAGQLPLWNPFNALGLPQAFNFQSAPFALSSLASYLVPLKQAFATEVIVKSLIAGTGGLFLGRCLKMSTLAALFAATAFELSGPFTAWLGWPQSGSVAWLPWMLGAALLILDDRQTARAVALLALSVAMCTFAGHPETLLLNVGCVGILVVASIAARGRALATEGPAQLRRALLVLAGGAAGLALAAPLLLPGIPVLRGSIRNVAISYPGLPSSYIGGLLSPGLHGFPVTGSRYTGSLNYYDAADWVGAATVLFGLTALLSSWRRRGTQVMGAIGLLFTLVLFVRPVSHLVSSVPVGRILHWDRATIPLALAWAMLAGFGIDALRRRWREPAVQRALAIAAGIVALGLVGLLAVHLRGPATGPLGAAELRSLAWPLAIVVLAGLAAVVLRTWSRLDARASHRRAGTTWPPRIALGALVAVGLANLVLVSPQLWSSSTTFYATTPGVAALRAHVGDARVGFGGCATLNGLPPSTGILIDSNIAYGVAEFAAYDTIISRALFESWQRSTGAPLDLRFTRGAICPSIPSASVARHFGIGFVLEPPGHAGPTGTTYVTTIDGEPLYRVPGAALATLAPRGAPADGAGSLPLRTTRPTYASIQLTTRSARATTLYVHEEAYPGWHVSVDGHPTAFSLYDGVMLKLDLPAGSHVVTLRYQPASFLWGIALALAAALGLTTWLALDARRGRRGGPPAQ
jgi:hypothetical protein